MITKQALHPNLVAFQTILSKEILRFLRIWTQTLIPPVITMSLYFIIFGKFIGSQIKDIEGYTYIQFIVPGLTIMSIMTNAYANTTSSFFLAKFNKSIEEMLVSPMSNFVILSGYVLGGAIRGIVVGLIVFGIAKLFTSVPILHPIILIAMGTLSALVFSIGGFINALFAKRFDDISFIPTFVLTPLTYLGGVFYSIQQLPPAWRTISQFNPLFSMVDTFRFGLLGISDLSIAFGFSLIIALFVILFVWAYWLLKRGTGIKV